MEPGRAGWGAVPAGLVLGAAVQLQQPALWGVLTYAACLLAALAGMACLLLAAAGPARWRRGVGLLLLAAAVGFGLAGWRAARFAGGAIAPALEGADITLVGVVAALPQDSGLGPRFRFGVEQATAGGNIVDVPPLALLGWWGGGPVAAGERWRLGVRLKAPHGGRNPHGFDYELWLWEQGIQATGSVRSGERLGTTRLHPVEAARQRVRDAIFAAVPDRAQAGVLAALAVGDQQAIERADWDVFRATGVAHLMSISGLHVTMFAWAAGLLVGWAWRRSTRLCLAWPAQHAGLAGGIVLATAYAVFSGWGVPSQRTVCMLATVGLLRLAGRRWPWPVTWLLAAAVLVTLDPWALAQAGFWLSFVAVGVLFATDSGAAHAGGVRAAARFASMLREQAVVTLALAPLSLLLFGQLSLVGLVANLLAIPWVSFVVTPLALLGALVPAAWQAGAGAVALLAWGLRGLAAWPGAVLWVAAPPLWAGAAGLGGGLLLALRLPPAWRALGLPLLLPVLLWQPLRPVHGSVELLAADVGQGNAVLVRTATHALLYDTGPRWGPDSDAGLRVLVPLLRALGERLDLVVVSHRDSDHSGGIAAVLAQQPDAAFSTSAGELRSAADARPQSRCEAGQAWEWDGVRFAFLHPGPEVAGVAPRPNAVSCVLRIDAAGASALLAGDIEAPQEQVLLAAGAPLRADLLLVPHHGSRTSSTAAFLAAVRPSIAVVQAGYRNRFGHPAPDVVRRLCDAGARVVASPACGALRWSSDQPAEAGCEREASPTYWGPAGQRPDACRRPR